MASYAYITQGSVMTQLASRLYDPNENFWSRAEKRLYLAEALRVWNCLTGYFRGEFTFPAVTDQHFYDLTAQTNTLIPYTLKDTDIYSLVQYHLLEPSVGVNPWTGVSSQFTADDLISALTRRRDEALSSTGCTITRRLISAVFGRITLPDTVLDIRRMAYQPSVAGQSQSVMWPGDAFAEQAFNYHYVQSPPGTPQNYLLSTQPTLSFDVDVPPAFGGNYELLTVEAGTPFSATTPQLLGIWDDFYWVLKMGVLSDLFNREANSRDIVRGQHCERIYRLGLSLMESAASLLTFRVNNVPVQIDAVRDADLYNPGWQAAASNLPAQALVAGDNLIALSPSPDSTSYSLTANVVKNAPIPTSDTDFVQIGRDDLDPILDYCAHTAMLKVGGAEFMATMPLLERFLKAAAIYSSKLAENAEFNRVLFEMSHLEDDMNPRMVSNG